MNITQGIDSHQQGYKIDSIVLKPAEKARQEQKKVQQAAKADRLERRIFSQETENSGQRPEQQNTNSNTRGIRTENQQEEPMEEGLKFWLNRQRSQEDRCWFGGVIKMIWNSWNAKVPLSDYFKEVAVNDGQ